MAGTRDPQGGFVSSADVLLRRTLPVDEADGSGVGGPAQNTTITVVATDAPLGSTDLTRLARMAATAVAARISPVHTPFDGDLTFAISSAPVVEPVGPQDLLALGAGARRALEDAIVNAVRPADR